MAIDFTRAPFPLTYRNLWLPRGIRDNTSMLDSRYNGNLVTLTGARKGTTCDGVRGTGANTSNVNYGAQHDNAVKFWVSFRFMFDQDFSSAAATDQFIWGKYLDATHYLWLVFRAADGKLYFEGEDGGAQDFTIAAQNGVADIASWTAGQWYQVYASISDANAVRFIVDNGTVVTDVSVIAAPNGGDIVFLDYDDPGAGTGFEGVIVDYFSEEGNDLTANEEYNLYAGVPPATVDNEYLLDEGRGVTAYDRGVDGNNGTLDTTATWAWGQVQQPVLSLDGRNDRGESSDGMVLSLAWTFIEVLKMKSTYDTITGAGTFTFAFLRVDATNLLQFQYSAGRNRIEFYVNGGGVAAEVDYTVRPTIDEYLIFIGTATLAGILSLYVNGLLIGIDTGLGAIAGGAATAYIGSNSTPTNYDISKPLMVTLIEGAFTAKQVRDYSRWINEILNLGLAI